jgi:hypothetical protein
VHYLNNKESDCADTLPEDPGKSAADPEPDHPSNMPEQDRQARRMGHSADLGQGCDHKRPHLREVELEHHHILTKHLPVGEPSARIERGMR